MSATAEVGTVDAVVIGAGFSGILLVHRLRQEGFTLRAFESAQDVGGTWYWNRYPGARCDVESLHYSYFFDEDLARGWEWSERFAAQPEILRYANWVADRLDIRREFTFGTRVDGADYDEHTATWTVRTDGGEVVRTRFLIPAVGALSASSVPDLPGLADFAGRVLHTGSWPHEPVDLSGLRVGVVGTGSSGIQAIPRLAEEAASVTVFQRTPNFTLPARNRPLYLDELTEARRRFGEIREQCESSPTGMPRVLGHQRSDEVPAARRREMFELEWKRGGVAMLAAFSDTSRDLAANELVADFVRERIAAIVEDPATAEKLSPRDYPIGAKRIALDTDYYATYNLPHVSLVDLREEPLVGLTDTALATTRAEYELDVLVLATGFDAMTGPLTRMGIRGRGGVTIADAWREGARNYLGLAVAGFPNMFTVTGPGSPSVLVNMFRAIEQHVDWILDCLIALRDRGVSSIEATPEAQDAWVATVGSIGAQTLYVRADSWYVGANIEGKPRVFLPYAGGLLAYRAACDEAAADGYRGFDLRPAAPAGVSAS